MFLFSTRTRAALGVDKRGTWPVMCVLAELGLGVPGAMFLGRLILLEFVFNSIVLAGVGSVTAYGFREQTTCGQTHHAGRRGWFQVVPQP